MSGPHRKDKPFLLDLDIQEIENMLEPLNAQPYRSRQIWEGLYQHLWCSPDEFSTLPTSLRSRLAEMLSFSHLQPAQVIRSSDGETVKTLFRLPDDLGIEAVLMFYGDSGRGKNRRTLCISTQAGCVMGCVFCATGQMGFRRNLSSGEIIEQVLYYSRLLNASDEKVTNVVLMGMGEPFHNYDAVMEAIDRLGDPSGTNIGARRFTISTVGVIPAMRRFADERRQVNLAVSLHAANDDLRASMLPINRKYSITELMDACRYYIEKTHRRVTFEWALIEGVNDSPEDAHSLALLLGGLLCHVNVIPLNPTQGYDGKATTSKKARAFQAELVKYGIPCTVRLRRGIDIKAGCGQLAFQADEAKHSEISRTGLPEAK